MLGVPRSRYSILGWGKTSEEKQLSEAANSTVVYFLALFLTERRILFPPQARSFGSILAVAAKKGWSLAALFSGDTIASLLDESQFLLGSDAILVV
mmetsp:Transcript_99402/g.148859  ORF Transcript_99402/g.148859 Transcript_99402/m.148859 type:complete len:96 (+) Transcript_99402:225-512(+)